MRRERGKTLPHWNKWCYLPFAGWIAIISKGCEISEVSLAHTYAAPLYAAVGAWRTGRGVYRFDETLLKELANTPVEGVIPCEVIFRLPEWCVYIEADMLGFQGTFVYLEEDMNNGEKELRFLFMKDGVPMPAVIHLGDYSLAEGVRRAVETARTNTMRQGLDYSASEIARDSGLVMKYAASVMPLVLYICSANAEMRRRDNMEEPRVRATPKGKASKTAYHPIVWEVGYRIGAAIRAGRSQEDAKETPVAEYPGAGVPKRPHVRRAHWHGYWTGPRDGKRMFALKWLPPIPVNIDTEGDGPIVVHPVEEKKER